MAKVEWTVRVVLYSPDTRPTTSLSGMWIEQLKHMGYVKVLSEDDKHTVLEFPCLFRGLDTHHWAEQEALRMESFGINAVAAPKWLSSEPRP